MPHIGLSAAKAGFTQTKTLHGIDDLALGSGRIWTIVEAQDALDRG